MTKDAVKSFWFLSSRTHTFCTFSLCQTLLETSALKASVKIKISFQMCIPFVSTSKNELIELVQFSHTGENDIIQHRF